MNRLRYAPYAAALALLVYMPLHVFLSQSLSVYTGGLDAWKIGKDIALPLIVMFTICLVIWQRRGDRLIWCLLAGAAVYGLLHIILWLARPDIYDRSAMIGIVYNMRLPLSLLLGYSAVVLLPKFAFSSIIKVMLGVSTIVVTLGVIQFFLPGDVLSHIGYSLERGARAVFYIDDNQQLPHRIMSTLREPNALGAYLILPCLALLTLLLRGGNGNRQYMLGGMLGLHLLALFLTFSRSAWVAMAVSAVLVFWWQYRDKVSMWFKRYWPLAAGAIVILATVTYSVRDSFFFQQYIIHSNPQEQVADLDSNDYHALLVKQGLQGIAEQPLGHGPGTAGLASIQNPAGGQLTENYYVQIGYELGILGAALFIAANVWLFIRIWKRHDYVAVILGAGFCGYVITNMLLHTWSNEAVALQWWLLAGMALAAKPILKDT